MKDQCGGNPPDNFTSSYYPGQGFHLNVSSFGVEGFFGVWAAVVYVSNLSNLASLGGKNLP